MLQGKVDFYIPSCAEIRGKRDIKQACRELDAAGVTSVVLYIPIFVSPVLVSHAARLLTKPFIVVGNCTKGAFSQTALLAAAGAIDQIGIKYKRLSGDITDDSVVDQLLNYIKALNSAAELKGMTFGCLGGRSLGISTGTADPAQWERIFGVDIEHIDQLEIVKRAENVCQVEVESIKRWIVANYGGIFYQEGRFGDQQLEKAIRSYLAVKEIINHYELDFVGIKCQPDLSNNFVVQCLAVQMLNDPYDASGPKEPIVCSCEADHDGALTMQILKLLSGGKPTALQDIFVVNDSEMVLANCGSMASCFSCLSNDYAVNLKDVYLQPHGLGDAGGPAVQFVCAESVFTYARLFRVCGQYRMIIFKGTTVKKTRESLKEYSWYRPTSFVNVQIDSKQLISELGSNHIHCVQGDYVRDLAELCQYLEIEYTVY
ncbi:MAG: hypothetical protein ABIG61_15625 [Planctomycetota bacterium]